MWGSISQSVRVAPYLIRVLRSLSADLSLEVPRQMSFPHRRLGDDACGWRPNRAVTHLRCWCIASSTPPRDTGSRTVLDILLRRKSDSESPDGWTVSCFLRSAYEPLPPRFRQGVLRLVGTEVSWAPGIYGRGQRVELPSPMTVKRVRPVGGRGEWNIKRRLFEVIEVDSDAGLLELAVPKASSGLVARSISRRG